MEKKSRDPKAKLRAALNTLESFTKTHIELAGIHVFHHAEGGSELEKIIRLTTHFIATTLSKTYRENAEKDHQRLEQALLSALDEVKRYHPLVSRIKGHDAEVLTKQTKEIIRTFNRLIENEESSNNDWKARLVRFLIRKPAIALNKAHTVRLSEPATAAKGSANLQKMFSGSMNADAPKTISDREADAFRMKAISLITNRKIPIPSIRAALESIRTTPITATLCNGSEAAPVPSGCIIHLEQRLTLLPGETVILRGAFKRDPEGAALSTPILDSFKLTSSSMQTGFPHPLQNNGWALTGCLIPVYPLRPELLPSVAVLLKKREEASLALRKREPLLQRAATMLEQKQAAFVPSQSLLLGMHQKLCKTILASIPGASASHEVVANYFAWLSGKKNAFQCLAEHWNAINDIFIEGPCRALHTAWTEQKDPNLFHENPRKRCETAKKILRETLRATANADDSSEVAAFIHYMGSVIGIASSTVVLQYYSEALEYPPPVLAPLEKKLQACAWRQLERFIDELDNGKDIGSDSLQVSLAEDVKIFENPQDDFYVCMILSRYYAGRFNPE